MATRSESTNLHTSTAETDHEPGEGAQSSSRFQTWRDSFSSGPTHDQALSGDEQMTASQAAGAVSAKEQQAETTSFPRLRAWRASFSSSPQKEEAPAGEEEQDTGGQGETARQEEDATSPQNYGEDSAPPPSAAASSPSFPRLRAWRNSLSETFAGGGAGAATTTRSEASADEEENDEKDGEDGETTSAVPGSLSITVLRNAETTDDENRFLWKLDLEKKEETQDIVFRGFLPESSLAALQEREETIFLQPGDVLETINGCSCKELSVIEVQELLDDNHDSGGGGLVTLVVTRTCAGADPTMVQATAITFNSTVAPEEWENRDMNTGIEFGEPAEQQQEEQQQSSDLEQEEQQNGDTQQQAMMMAKKLGAVKISAIQEDGNNSVLAHHSVLQVGDIVLSINRSDCSHHDCTAEDAQVVLHSKFMGADYVSLVVRRDTPKATKWTVRKAAVAVAGGSMVSVGAVIMATPLHPIGHAMAIGGVGVLATEFEGPRRVVASATESFRRSWNRTKSNDEEDDDDDGNNKEDETEKDSTEKEPSKAGEQEVLKEEATADDMEQDDMQEHEETGSEDAADDKNVKNHPNGQLAHAPAPAAPPPPPQEEEQEREDQQMNVQVGDDNSSSRPKVLSV